MDLDRAVAASGALWSARRIVARTRWVGALVATVALLGSAACTATGRPGEPSEPGETITVADWRAVALPAGMTASSLAVVGGDLLVGGSVGSGVTRTPALARGPATGGEPTLSPVPLRPTTPYGELADLVSVTGADARVIAVGVAHGGAHANPRWTVWTGTADGLVDRPQTFETFGGQEAGGLLGAAADSRGPLLVGTWRGEHGLDGAIWRADGERWRRRQPTAAALASTADRQVSPRTVQPQVDGSVTVAGSVIELGAGEVRQRAAYWRDIDGVWTLRLLDDPGSRSWAWSTACDSRCWTVGVRDGQLAVWSDRRRVAVPAIALDDRDSGVIVVYEDRVVVAIGGPGSDRLLVRDDGAWRVYAALDGPVLAAALGGSRMFLAVGESRTGLWSVDLAGLD